MKLTFDGVALELGAFDLRRFAQNVINRVKRLISVRPNQLPDRPAIRAEADLVVIADHLRGSGVHRQNGRLLCPARIVRLLRFGQRAETAVCPA
jgi:hypothetical protein